jgi:hypothetical protein
LEAGLVGRIVGGEGENVHGTPCPKRWAMPTLPTRAGGLLCGDAKGGCHLSISRAYPLFIDLRLMLAPITTNIAPSAQEGSGTLGTPTVNPCQYSLNGVAD